MRRVPTQRDQQRAQTNVPTRLPTVEIAYMRPATVPLSSTRSTASRIAYGDAAPSSITGARPAR